jgi:acetylornithine deacetylase
MKRLAELVALPSVSSTSQAFDTSNAGVAAKLAEWFEDRGFRARLEIVARGPDKVNVIATAGHGDEGLILAGHTDTVPYDRRAWHSDPFALTERDGKLHGLGIADMKCFFPLVLEALEGVDLARLRQPLTLLGTADEESTMCGARALATRAPPPGRYVLIGEPTGLTPIHSHKGVVWVAVTVLGTAGHASDPSLGRNAIEGMQRVLDALFRWRAAAAERHHDAQFGVPAPTLNVGTIQGGDNPNRICPRCEIQCDIRILPSMDAAQVLAEIRAVVEAALADTGFDAQVRPLIEPIPPLLTSFQSSIVRFTEQVTGRRAQTVAFGTEGPFFNALGKETVILGPGDIAAAHQANEYVAVERIAPMIDILRNVIRHYCV